MTGAARGDKTSRMLSRLAATIVSAAAGIECLDKFPRSGTASSSRDHALVAWTRGTAEGYAADPSSHLAY